MKYVYITNESIVLEVIPEFLEAFPDFPIETRYAKAFLDNCLPVPDEVEVATGWEYFPLENEFRPYVPPDEVEQN